MSNGVWIASGARREPTNERIIRLVDSRRPPGGPEKSGSPEAETQKEKKDGIQIQEDEPEEEPMTKTIGFWIIVGALIVVVALAFAI